MVIPSPSMGMRVRRGLLLQKPFPQQHSEEEEKGPIALFTLSNEGIRRSSLRELTGDVNKIKLR